jgi:hypothetical protein
LTGETVFALKAWDTEELVGVLLAHSSPTGEQAVPPRAPAFEVLGPADGFEPGVYSRLGLALALPARHFADPRVRLEQYLRDAYLPYSLRRDASFAEGVTRYSFDVPKKGLKKKILYEGSFTLSERGMDAHLDVGPGFDLMGFFATFRERAHYSAQSRITSVKW